MRASYFDKQYGPAAGRNAVTLNLAIGQGENDQTVVEHGAVLHGAGDGRHRRATPRSSTPDERTKLFDLTPEQMEGLRDAMAGVVSTRGNGGERRLKGVIVAGKTGTAQTAHKNGIELDHAWFVGLRAGRRSEDRRRGDARAGADHGSVAARIASKMIERYLKRPTIQGAQLEGD